MDEREREIRATVKGLDRFARYDLVYLLSLLDQEREEKAELLEALERLASWAEPVQEGFGIPSTSPAANILHEIRALLAKHKERA